MKFDRLVRKIMETCNSQKRTVREITKEMGGTNSRNMYEKIKSLA